MQKMTQILCVVLMICLFASCSSANNSGNTIAQSGSADAGGQSGEAPTADEGSETDTVNQPLEMPDPSEAGALHQGYFKFRDQVYKFPMSIEDFEKIEGTTCISFSGDHGGYISGEQLSEKSLAPFETYAGGTFTIDMSAPDDDSKSFCTYLKNPTSEEIPFSQAQVAGINIWDARLLPECFEFPGGITMSSTKDEVLAAYGKPNHMVVNTHIWRKTVMENDKIVESGIAIRFNDDGQIESIKIGINLDIL